MVWATALYAGLRYGELRAIRWGAVDTAGGRLAVRESWDQRRGRHAQDPDKPAHGADARSAPRPLPGAAYERYVTEDDPVFGPFHATALYRRADEAWAGSGCRSGCELHQARHTYAEASCSPPG